MKTNYCLEFKWTVSRGRDTYGYNICSLFVDGKKVSSCNGGGYDMIGTSFGEWIGEHLQEDIKKLDPKKFYGLSEYDGKMYVDGSCGFESVTHIVKELGFSLEHIPTKKENRMYRMYKH